MDFLEFKTGTDDKGRRLDKVLRIFNASLSLAQIYKALRKGLIKVNNKKSQPDYRIQDQDVISIAKFLIQNDQKPGAESKNPAKTELEVVFKNEHFIIVNKPAGINIHPANKKEASLIELVNDYYSKNYKNDSLAFKPGPLHRLDKMTSGLVCFSASYEGARWFSSIMQEHGIKKTYKAIVQGKMTEPRQWEDLLQKDDEAQGYHTVKISQEGKKSITIATPVKTGIVNGQELTEVEFRIETGRQHQIRAQASYHDFPLWGDTAYGGKKDKYNGGRYYLCAYKLEFPQNELGLPPVIEIECPPCDINTFNI